MKFYRILSTFLTTLAFSNVIYAKSLDLPPIQDIGPFIGLEATVGYIQKENGEKFMVVETPDGTKVVKVRTNPKKLMEKQSIK